MWIHPSRGHSAWEIVRMLLVMHLHADTAMQQASRAHECDLIVFRVALY